MEVGARRCRGSVRKNLAEEDREGQRTAGSPCSAPGCLVGGRARPACAAGMPRTDACAAYAAGAGVTESLLGGPVPCTKIECARLAALLDLPEHPGGRLARRGTGAGPPAATVLRRRKTAAGRRARRDRDCEDLTGQTELQLRLCGKEANELGFVCGRRGRAGRRARRRFRGRAIQGAERGSLAGQKR